MANLFVRNLQYNEMPYLIDLLAKEGWNPGFSDADFFFRTDTNAFLIIFENEKPAGCISAVNYNNQFAFLGSHIILPEFRKRGIGSHLLSIAIQKLGTQYIGLNCFENQISFYNKVGFQPAHKILTFKGITDGKLIMDDSIVSPYMHPFAYLEDYDKKCFPTNRRHFLMNWLSQPKSLVLAKLDNKKYSGFGFFRPCLDGYKIAPLFGDNFKAAEDILLALIGHMEIGSSYYIDLPETNDCALRLAEKFNLTKVNETVRMYNNTTPKISLEYIYSFASFELG